MADDIVKEEKIEEKEGTSVEETKEEVKETPKVEEKSDETVSKEEPESKDQGEKEEEFDLEEFKKTTAEEAQKAVLEKIAAGLGLTKEEKKQSQDEGLIPPWEKRGETRPKSWKEHAEYSADLAQWKRKKEDEEIAKIQQETEKEAKAINKKWNDYWDSELEDLVNTGKIPKVENPDDANDPGKKARIKLFSEMQKIGLERQQKGLSPITSLKLIFYEHYKDDEPAGADAPVSFGKKGVDSSNKEEYSYHDIHKPTFDQIKRK